MRLSVTLLLLFFLFSCGRLPAQTTPAFVDGRESDGSAVVFKKLMEQKPPEVQFGVSINESGDVFFQINSEKWFNLLFHGLLSISADIVSKDRYSCDGPPAKGLLRGTLLPPVRPAEFKSRMTPIADGYVTLKIGTVPRALLKKQLEANLVVLRYNIIVYYSNFLDIPRSVWDLLPMGLYTDTLLNAVPAVADSIGGSFVYERRVQVVVPFAKNKDVYEGGMVQRVYDSLQLKNCVIQKVKIRAYSSVEGSETANTLLMRGRANAMVAVLKKLQPGLSRVSVLTAENWLEFYRGLKGGPYESFDRLTRAEIKVKLLDKAVATALEPELAGERKAILTIYYGQRSGLEGFPKEGLLTGFARAIAEKKVVEARKIEKEIFQRVEDGRLPDSYLNKLEIPREEEFWELLNDRALYQYELSLSDGPAVIDSLRAVASLAPGNGKIAYNICALTLYTWHFGDAVDRDRLLKDLDELEGRGIDHSLVRRMMINYHILLSFELLRKEQYAEKDKSVFFIKSNYEGTGLSDEDRFALAKYFTFYSQHDWAKQLIIDRVDQVDVAEDLVFYFVNLGFFRTTEYNDEKFVRALLNASTLNRARFCEFFNPIGRGGAGMQLLEEQGFRLLYCEKCSGVR